MAISSDGHVRVSHMYLQQKLSYIDKLVNLGSIKFTILCQVACHNVHKIMPKYF